MPRNKLNMDNAINDIKTADLKDKTNKNKNPKSEDNKKNKQEYDGSYKTSFLMRPDYDDIYMTIRKKFRKNLKTTISKQDALEIGLILFNNIDSSILEELANDYPPEDNRIEELKKLLMEKQ